MIRPANPYSSPAHDGPSPVDRVPAEPSLYGRTFWFCYLANSALMTSISLQFRYSDFVTFFGGTELHLGWIVGIGTIGALAMRLWQGVGIDRYGPRQVWLGSLILYTLTVLGHLTVSSVSGPWVYVLRIAWSVAVAGAFGASITYISRTAATARMAEMIGMLGTSGFVGMAIGPTLGDLVFGSGLVQSVHLTRMFGIAAALGMVALLSAQIATYGQPAPARRRQPPLLWLLRRYHPGAMLLVGVAMGFGIGMPGVFLRSYTAELGIGQMKMFFLVYTATAFLFRVLARRLPERLGVRPMILAGLTSLVLSMLSYPLVESRWHLVLPAVLAGTAHALLFPSVVAGGARSFPDRYRGLATTLMLGMFDLGSLVGAPLIGAILYYSPHLGLPAYPTMFVSVAAILALIAGVFARSRSGAVAKPAVRSKQRSRAAGQPRPESVTQMHCGPDV